MTQKTTKLIGWILSGIVSLALAASATDKIMLSQHALDVGALLGITPATYRVLGIIEITSALLFMIPRTGVAGLLLLSSYMGGAIATHLQHGQDILFPISMESIVWISAALRFPELTQRLYPQEL